MPRHKSGALLFKLTSYLKVENRPEESGRFFHSPKPTLVQQGYKEGSEIVISHFAPHPLLL